MTTALFDVCDLNNPLEQPDYLFIQQHIDIDGNFLISSFLQQRLKMKTSNSSVLLVCTEQTSNHYQNSCLKLGFNLKTFMDANKLKIIDLLTGHSMNNNPILDLNKLLLVIQKQIDELKSTDIEQITIIFDNLQYFLIFNHLNSENKLIEFCENLHNITKKTENCSIICKFNLSNIHEYVCNNVCSIADYSMNVDALKSGKFREVDGKIMTKCHRKKTKVNNENSFDFDLIVKEILFKINERNIKIYYPGEFGIKV